MLFMPQSTRKLAKSGLLTRAFSQKRFIFLVLSADTHYSTQLDPFF